MQELSAQLADVAGEGGIAAIRVFLFAIARIEMK
jgi:hypothetical protein